MVILESFALTHQAQEEATKAKRKVDAQRKTRRKETSCDEEEERGRKSRDYSAMAYLQLLASTDSGVNSSASSSSCGASTCDTSSGFDCGGFDCGGSDCGGCCDGGGSD